MLTAGHVGQARLVGSKHMNTTKSDERLPNTDDLIFLYPYSRRPWTHHPGATAPRSPWQPSDARDAAVRKGVMLLVGIPHFREIRQQVLR